MTLTKHMHEQKNILEIKDLYISYGDRPAVSGISLSVRPHEIFGLLGPNGAGKTSTLSAIEGLLKPQSGNVSVAGFDIFKHPLDARANLGIQLQATSFHQDLNVYEIIELYAGLYGVAIAPEKIHELIAEIKLENDSRKKASQLSGGQQQRLALVIATLHNPPLLLLDEPTTGLDPQSRRQLWERIEKIRDSGRGIVLTTHSMEEARAVCDRVAIIDHGKIITIDTPQNLIETYKDDADVRALSRRGEVTLEDVFIALTGREVRH
jgi:ABC-2 type transport system ATP-binding protein